MRLLPMQKLLIMACLALFPGFSSNIVHAQSNPDTIRRKDADGWVFMQVKKDGYVNAEGSLHNGIIEGVWSTYWSSGYPQTLTSYVHGKKDGLQMRMLEEGILDYIQHFKDDKLEGPKRTYHIRGPIYEETYYSNDKKNGKYTKWYKSGRKQEEGAFINDLRHGTTIWYNENGKKAAQYEYDHGEMEGSAVFYHPNEKVSEMGKYSKSEKTGTWKEFFESGNIKAEGKYEHNEKQGPWKNYDDEGKGQQIINYDKGEEVKKK